MTEKDSKIINIQDVKAKAAGVQPELADVIRQLNERFQINIEITDERLELFKQVYPALDEAAKQGHGYQLNAEGLSASEAFQQGIDVGKAQMMTDVIVCLLEQAGLIERS